MPASAIGKRRRVEPLNGRRVAVPQEMFGFDDGDSFFFQGTVKATASSRCLVRFDYTGEEEWFPHTLTRRWLLREVPIGPLCSLLEGL